MIPPSDDTHWMRMALREAEAAFTAGEVPIGAVIVCRDTLIARAHNLTERLTDVTAHAEMQAITAAAAHIGGKYLAECTLYVTLEPCTMCAGATAWAHMGRIVYGAPDPKGGYARFGQGLMHPKTRITTGVLEAECAELLRTFFRERRKG